MKSSFRVALVLVSAAIFVAVIASCSSGDSDLTTTPENTQVQATARPTITPVPTATNTPGPTPTPEPTPTPTPTPTATPTPPPPDSYVHEMGRLFSELGIDFSTLFVSRVGHDQWPTEALGCPEPGMFYDVTNAPYRGTYYVISNGSIEWEYHVNEDDTVTVRCDERTPSNAPLVNIAEEANLESTTKLTLMRRDFDTGNFEVRREMTPEDTERVIAIFGQSSGISYAPPCESVFRLDFETSSGKSVIEFICADNYEAFDIYWNELHGTAPILGYIIGPYLTGDPVPTLPDNAQ